MIIAPAYKKIAILGAGDFGVALSKLSSDKAEQVSLWCREPEVCEIINNDHHHPTKLSFVRLKENIRAKTDISLVLHDAEVVILTLPLEALPEVLLKAAAFINQDALIISTSKGIAPETLFLPKDIINNTLSVSLAKRACYLSGPSFARELAIGLPTAMTLASLEPKIAQAFQKNFSTPECRLYYSSDVIGVCAGGALKNVIAIASGACFKLGLGKNAQASLITRGLAEMARLTEKMGGKKETLMGLSGVGDLVLSATDAMSRNYRLGTFLAEGFDMKASLEKIGGVVEGAKTAAAIPQIIKKYGVELPISQTVYKVLYEALPPLEALHSLQKRVPKDENGF